MILRPDKKLINFTSLLGIAGVFLGLIRIFYPEVASELFLTHLWLLACVCLLFVVLLDLYQLFPKDDVKVDRVLPSSFALHRQQAIQFNIQNNSSLDLFITFSDGVPLSFQTTDFPLKHEALAGQTTVFEYHVIPMQRGDAKYAPAFLQIQSKQGFWQFRLRLGEEDQVRVYPDFSAIINSAVLGMEQNMRYIGAHLVRQKGGGLEFNQLREFRSGDTLKQVDWKASARLDAPISREYQEERDQNVVFLLDCSRRMRVVENELSYFDHALNAILTSSYIALDKGDAVGMMSFSGEASWLPPVKGKNSINRILNHLYDAETSTQSSDYIQAAEELLQRQHKRSLIVIMTNIRDEDQEDLEAAVNLLEKQHLVLVVALREDLLTSIDHQTIESDNDAYVYAGVKQFAQARQTMLTRLRAYGVSVVDATYQNLHVKLVSEYLLLKQSGKI